jgi:membrane protein DedA with SNARE-associated domain
MDFIYSFILNFKIRLFDLNNYYIFIPIFILFFSFLETSSPVGFILPSNVISILFFTLIFDNSNIFIYIFLIYFSGIFLWLLVWYYLWYYFNDKINILTKKKFPTVDKYFLKIDHYFDKYHFLTFLLICNIPYIRSYFSIHMWSRHYNFSRYLLWSLSFSFFYVFPRALIGFLIWKFWQAIVYKYLHQWKMVIIYILLFLLILIMFWIFKYRKKRNLNQKNKND